jgi:hypothetical protein
VCAEHLAWLLKKPAVEAGLRRWRLVDRPCCDVSSCGGKDYPCQGSKDAIRTGRFLKRASCKVRDR